MLPVTMLPCPWHSAAWPPSAYLPGQGIQQLQGANPSAAGTAEQPSLQADGEVPPADWVDSDSDSFDSSTEEELVSCAAECYL